MGFRMIVPKRIKKKRTKDGQEVLRCLEEFLKSDTVMEEPVEILCGFWEDQQNAITYQELRKAVKAGGLTQETLKQWQQDYAYLVKTKLTPMWEKAMEVGALKQPLVEAIAGGFVFQTQTPDILSWLRQRGAEFVTSCTTQQKEAIAALVSKKMIEGHTVDELARMIRPCIGLTKEQAKANARYYDHVAATLKEKFPTMRPKTIQKRAQEAAGKYAERQHRARAMTIAQTESAFAYNHGADEGIRQAQVQGLIGKTKKKWNTAGTDSVCKICAELDGKEFEMDADFPLKGEPLFPGQHKLPPAHPRCGCAIEYIEIEPPKNIANNDISGIIKLTEMEQQALNHYFSFDSYVVNEKLRKNIELNLLEQLMVNNLDSALKKMPRYNGILSRSLYFGDKLAVDKFLENFEIGNKISFDEYISTTYAKELYNPDGEVQIFIKDAKNGRDVTSMNKQELEVLYERKSEFIVRNVVVHKDKWYILLEEYEDE